MPPIVVAGIVGSGVCMIVSFAYMFLAGRHTVGGKEPFATIFWRHWRREEFTDVGVRYRKRADVWRYLSFVPFIVSLMLRNQV
jgi:hypothetical protein